MTEKHTKKIQVQLTSIQDQVWTWRKVGTKYPKGTLAAEMLSPDVKLEDEIWIEISTNIDGIVVESVLDAIEDNQVKGETLELLGSREFKPVRMTRDFKEFTPKPKRGKSKKTRNSKSKDKSSEQHRRKPKETRPESKVPKRQSGEKLCPNSKHRDKWLGSLSSEERPVGEVLLKGGMPAIRKAIEDAEIKGENLVQMAEDLGQASRLAEWHDKANAAKGNLDKICLKDLRIILAASESFRQHEDVLELADEIREGLMERLEQAHENWLLDINTLIEEERIIRALHMSSRPPKAGKRMPEELATRLAGSASKILTGDISQKRWISFLEAIARSPVGQKILPVSYPMNPSPELIQQAKRSQKFIPEIAAELIRVAEENLESARA